MSSSFLLQQCPMSWMVLEMGVRWPYSCYFVGCCIQDLFNIAHSILIQLIYLGGIYWWDKNTAIDRLPWLSIWSYDYMYIIIILEICFICLNKWHSIQMLMPENYHIVANWTENCFTFSQSILTSFCQWPRRPWFKVILKTQIMVLDAALLRTQHYKVCINGKIEQSRERRSTVPYTLM